MAHSSKGDKPAKPRPDFPLFAHASGRWAKKVRGKLHYFGKWDDPVAALAKWLDQKDDLLAGRTPRPKADGLTIRNLCNKYLTHKRHLADAGEITARTFQEYYETADRIVVAFGKARLVVDLDASDFEAFRAKLAKTRGPVCLGNEISRVRSVFKFALDQGLIERPVRYGQSFKKPSAKTIRLARARNGKRLLEASEIRLVLEKANAHMRAFTLLGVNAGYGASDISALPLETVQHAIATGWLDFARPKTGVGRRCPLWNETRDALRAAISKRRQAKDASDAHLAFITKHGKRFTKPNGDDPIGWEFRKLLAKLDIKRPMIGFYVSRHVFRTVADECRDHPAIALIMGHAPAANDMAAVYRERIDDERLVAVVEYVHKWLFGNNTVEGK